jgi:hypothetical protein
MTLHVPRLPFSLDPPLTRASFPEWPLREARSGPFWRITMEVQVSLVRTSLAIGVVVVLAGCGSSRLSLPPNGFHSPTHQYSVRQVEAAFSAHGIQLHERKLPSQVQPNVVFLISGRGAGVVSISVKNGPTGHGLVPSGISKKYWPRLTKVFHGNVGVEWVSRGNAVEASLLELH